MTFCIRTFLRTFTTGIIAVTFTAVALGTPFNHAYANGFQIVKDPFNLIQTTITKAASNFIGSVTDALKIKEYVLDAIAFNIINMMIKQMTRDTVKWINSGFKGDPAFMKDFDKFMTGVTDRAVGQVIGGIELGNYLCKPFKIDIKYSLEVQYAAKRNFGSPANSCTLSGMEKNIEDFMNGKTIKGDWDDWFKVTQNPQYNVHGAFLMAQEQLNMKVGTKKAQEKEKLSWSKGFLSSEQCVRKANSESGEYCAETRTVTPGSAIESSLNEALGAQGRRIQVADEINEIFSALFGQLVTQAFQGAGGLLGLTGSGSSGAPTNPYYTNLNTQDTTSKNSLTNPRTVIERSIATETAYRTGKEQIFAILSSAATYKVDMYGSDRCHSGALTPELQRAYDDTKTEIPRSTATITTLNTLLAEYIAAGTDPELQRIASEKYMDLFSSGAIHSDADVRVIQSTEIPLAQEEVARFTADIDNQCMTNTADGVGSV